MKIYTMKLRQSTNVGMIEQEVEIVAKNETEAWKELHNGIYRYKDAELIKEENF